MTINGIQTIYPIELSAGFQKLRRKTEQNVFENRRGKHFVSVIFNSI